MTRLILNIMLLLSGQLLFGQILSPMGLGLPSAPDKIAKYGGGVVVAYDDRDGNIELQIWNGHFWNKITVLTKNNENTTSLIEISCFQKS